MNQSVQNLLKIIGLLIVIPVIALLVGSIISYIMPSGFSNIVAVGAGILTGVLCCLASRNYYLCFSRCCSLLHTCAGHIKYVCKTSVY